MGHSRTGTPIPQEVASWQERLQQLAGEWETLRTETLAGLEALEAEQEAAAQGELHHLRLQVGAPSEVRAIDKGSVPRGPLSGLRRF